APAERMVAYLSGQEEKLSYWESTGSNGSSSQLARILRDGSLYRQLRLLASEYIGNLALLGQDPEMEELVGEENDRIKNQIREQLLLWSQSLVPHKTDLVVVEIRSGKSTESVELFIKQLFDMYRRYAQAKGWSVNIIEDPRLM